MRLVGSAFGKGSDETTVANLAIAWGSRCDPPLGADEVLRIVRDLSHKQTVKIIDEPLPAAKPWPKLDRDALYGIAGNFVDLILPQTEADAPALLIQMLVAVGNVIGKGPAFRVGATWHGTNMFTAIVGATSKGRKGTGEDWVRTLIEFVDPDWASSRILDGLSSGEGLIYQVRDDVITKQPVKTGGKVTSYQEVVTDEGVEDKRLLILESEFAGVLRVMKRESNTLTAILRNAWDGKDLRTLTRNSPLKATRPHVSAVFHITSQELRRSLSAVENFSGFSNRILWCVSKRSKLLPDGGTMPDLSGIANDIMGVVEYTKLVEVVTRDAPAKALWVDIYREMASRTFPGALGAVVSRGEAQCLRLSLVYALLDRSSIVRVEHLRAAKALWDYCEASAGVIFDDSTGNPIADKVLAVIRRTPGVGRTEIHKATGNHVKASTLAIALGELRDNGLARVDIVDTAGRPAEKWYPAVGCEESELSELSPPRTPDEGLNSHNSQPTTDDDWEEFTI